MITRFEKILKQVARDGGDLTADRLALESHAQKVRRLEELIRAKETTGDRIVIGIGAALVVSSMALPVYAAFVREEYVYLPSVSPASTRNGSAADRRQVATADTAPAEKKDHAALRSTEPDRQTASSRQWPSATPFARYFIHRATEASALIEGPNGLWWVTPGMKIPGIGQILSIERSNGGWAVVTSETTITEAMAGNATN